MKILTIIKNLFIHKNDTKENDANGYMFKSDNSLIIEKLIEYIPAALITNLSTLLLLSVDGIVVGNYIGPKALSSVNVIYPATIMISFVATLLSLGISTSLSLYIGQHNYEKLIHIKSAMKLLIVIGFIFVSVVQIPIVNIIIASYNLDHELADMTYKYAIGVMLLNPFAIISTVGVYQLQIIGKMKVIMYLSIIESVLNLILDLLFVGVLKLGVTGAGYGTAIAGIIRSILTLCYILSRTEIYKSNNAKIRCEEIKEILSLGAPESIFYIIIAVQDYLMMKIILMAFGSFGGDIKGVCTFCYNIINVLMLGVVSSMRPLVGFFEGAKDTYSVRNVMKKGMSIIAAFILTVVLFVEIDPYIFYKFHGVVDVTFDDLLSLRLYALSFLFIGINAAYRLYLTNKRDTKFISIVNSCSYLFIPIVAYAFYKFFIPPTIWLAEFIVTFSICIIFTCRMYYFDKISVFEDYDVDDDKMSYIMKNKKVDYKKLTKLLDDRLLNMSVKPEEAIEASRYIRKYALEKGFSERISNRISLCMEEMLAYAVKSQNKKDIHTQIVIRFGKDEGIFMMFDDGKYIALDKDKVYRELTIDNYTLLKKVAKSYEYQYVLNMNYTKFTF